MWPERDSKSPLVDEALVLTAGQRKKSQLLPGKTDLTKQPVWHHPDPSELARGPAQVKKKGKKVLDVPMEAPTPLGQARKRLEKEEGTA